MAIEPLAREHEAGLQAAAADGELWRLWYTSVPAPDKTLRMDRRRARRCARSWVRCRSSSASRRPATSSAARAISTSTPLHRRLEIGHTWYAKRVQRTALNTEAKLLLLTHAFETLDCIAVEFRTSFFNFASREAIARLGAKQDGILRHHQRLPDGSLRDTVVFSIIAPEWPAVKKNLVWQLDAAANVEACGHRC